MHKLLVFGTALLAAAFILALGLQMPQTVASHFSLSGSADASMSRTPFVVLMTLMAAALPPLVWWLQVRQAARGTPRISSPSFWLAPERRDATLHWLSAHAAAFSVATSLFLCWVFWLVYLANTAPAPSLPLARFFVALFAYLVFTVAWAAALHLRFGRTRGVTS